MGDDSGLNFSSNSMHDDDVSKNLDVSTIQILNKSQF